jgi:glutamyl-tRNA synthetase
MDHPTSPAATGVRVRFAPSPTGYFHIGSARTALFNWLYARHTGGTFILRIEDTDSARNTDESLTVLLAGMRWLGIDWDEGPDIGGPCGPYFQSQRGAIYRDYLQRLTAAGRTYEADGAVWFRLEGERYREFDSYLNAEVEKVRAAPVTIRDAIRGDVVRAESRDFVLVRADGNPTFHFVNVVDDITMGITHVIRGEDHLSNTSKHLELFRALGAPEPQFAHLPLILKDPAIGKGKMSKRDRGALIGEYVDRHFIPAAVRNAIALLGWSPKDDREVLDIGEIIERFDIRDIQKGAARFDEKKMEFINFQYLKALPVETYAWFARPVLTAAGLLDDAADEDYLQRVLAICQPKITSLAELPAFCAFFFSSSFACDPKVSDKLLRDPARAATLIDQVLAALAAVPAQAWSEAALDEAFAALATAHGVDKPFQWWPLTRFAVSGSGGGAELVPMLAVLGRQRVIDRLAALRASLAG